MAQTQPLRRSVSEITKRNRRDSFMLPGSRCQLYNDCYGRPQCQYSITDFTILGQSPQSNRQITITTSGSFSVTYGDISFHVNLKYTRVGYNDKLRHISARSPKGIITIKLAQEMDFTLIQSVIDTF